MIQCPRSVQLLSISKERGTHGFVYCLWECERRTPVWVGQSIPALVRCINDKAVAAVEKRLHASSLYRCLRKEARKDSHKNWKVLKMARDEIEKINDHLSSFPSVVYCSKSPELWQCASEAAPSQQDAPQTAIMLGNVSGNHIQEISISASETQQSSPLDEEVRDHPRSEEVVVMERALQQTNRVVDDSASSSASLN